MTIGIYYKRLYSSSEILRTFPQLQTNLQLAWDIFAQLDIGVPNVWHTSVERRKSLKSRLVGRNKPTIQKRTPTSWCTKKWYSYWRISNKNVKLEFLVSQVKLFRLNYFRLKYSQIIYIFGIESVKEKDW